MGWFPGSYISGLVFSSHLSENKNKKIAQARGRTWDHLALVLSSLNWSAYGYTAMSSRHLSLKIENTMAQKQLTYYYCLSSLMRTRKNGCRYLPSYDTALMPKKLLLWFNYLSVSCLRLNLSIELLLRAYCLTANWLKLSEKWLDLDLATEWLNLTTEWLDLAIEWRWLYSLNQNWLFCRLLLLLIRYCCSWSFICSLVSTLNRIIFRKNII